MRLNVFFTLVIVCLIGLGACEPSTSKSSTKTSKKKGSAKGSSTPQASTPSANVPKNGMVGYRKMLVRGIASAQDKNADIKKAIGEAQASIDRGKGLLNEDLLAHYENNLENRKDGFSLTQRQLEKGIKRLNNPNRVPNNKQEFATPTRDRLKRIVKQQQETNGGSNK